MEVSGDESGGMVSLAGAGSDDEDADEESRESREECIQAALPGFGSVAESGDELLTQRTDQGGATVAARVARPSGAKSGERFITHKSGGIVRVTDGALAGTKFNLEGFEATGGIVIGADAIACIPPGVPGPQAAVRDQDTVVIGGYVVGKVVGSSLMVKIG